MKARKVWGILLLVSSIFLSQTLNAAESNDTITNVKKYPSFISLGGHIGNVLPTNSFVSGEYATPIYNSLSLKYAFSSAGDSWKEIAYGLPYYGAAINISSFYRPTELGTPISLYLFQGATILNLGSRVSLNYELNLGMSTGWKPYDPFTNPNNKAIGSKTNVHVAAGAYLKWYLSKTIDLHLGANLTHFSNGTSRQPNAGINMVGIYAEVAYNFNRDELIKRYTPDIAAPEYSPHFEHDIQLVMSSKNVKIDTVGTNLSDIYNDKDFDVFALNYYIMRAPNYRYRYGVGIGLQYDESSGAKMYNKLHENGKYYTITELGSMGERLSTALAARGELVLPYYSIFMDLSLSIINHNASNPRFTQALGVKIHLAPTIYATFGIKAENFSKAQYLYWSLGYTIRSKKTKWLPVLLKI